MGETSIHHLVLKVLMVEYNEKHYVENFKMTKGMLFYIINRLRSQIAKQYTTYKKLILVEIEVVCMTYKLVQGMYFFIFF
jgi:hypothetical protein